MRIVVSLIALASAAAFSPMTALSQETDIQTYFETERTVDEALEALRGSKRVLLVPFDEFPDQFPAVGHETMSELDLVMITLTKRRGANTILLPEDGGLFTYLPMKGSRGDGKRLQEKGIDSLQFSLIGKDGTLKKVWEEAVSAEELTALINSMPMRQQDLNDR